MRIFLITLIMLIACSLSAVTLHFIGTQLNPVEFITINEAINYAQLNSNLPGLTAYKIVVPPRIEPYIENIEISSMPKPLSIQGTFDETNPDQSIIENTVIDGNLSGPTIKITDNEINISDITIKGMTITNGTGLLGVSLEPDEHFTKGGGIYVENTNSVLIDWCYIEGNQASYGAGVYAYNNSIKMTNTKIFENYYDPATCFVSAPPYMEGGGIFSINTNTYIINTSIHSNGVNPLYQYQVSSKSGGLWIKSHNLWIEDSLIYKNISHLFTSGLFYTFNQVNNDNVQILNSTITDNRCLNSSSNDSHALYFDREYYQGPFVSIQNSIIYHNTYGISDANVDFPISPTSIYVNYCCTEEYYSNGNYHTYEYPAGNVNLYSNPYFFDSANDDYSLRWDTSIKSPCIDAGFPELVDTLYNRIDIGALEFDGFKHNTYTYTFPPRSVNHGIKWMSFPVLRNASNEPFANTIEAVDFFTHDNILYPDILEHIKWNDLYIAENNDNTIEYDVSWSNLNHVVTSPQGYKVQMDALNDVERRIAVSGFLQDLNTDIQLYGLHNGQYKENWLGYYYPKSQHVFDALNGFLDELWFIQTQHWTLIRQYSQLGGPWVGVLTPASKPLVLSPGDMVVVKCFRDCDFTWGDFGPQWQPQPPLKPEHFEYLEKLEYIPIMTDFRNSNLELPKEIAVYVNGICKGAAVVTDSLAQILAYICDDLPDDPELEFMLYYDSKSPVTMPAYEYWDSRTDTFRSDGLSLKDRQDYYLVKMKSNAAGETPLPRLYLTARPNPFNPSTRISYYLSKDSRVTLGIYNVKGQLVKTLIQESKTAGMQSAEWDGRDENGKPCVGGVYYCRLSAGGKRVSRKLTLLK